MEAGLTHQVGGVKSLMAIQVKIFGGSAIKELSKPVVFISKESVCNNVYLVMYVYIRSLYI